jgi:hypothetical protein
MGPREVVERLKQSYLGERLDGNLLADDVVLEWPFAAPGRPKRMVGRDDFLAMIAPQRAALPFRLDRLRVDAVHETADPEVVILEFELGGTVHATGERHSAAMVAVFRVRDGKVVLWREYQDTYAIAQAIGS